MLTATRLLNIPLHRYFSYHLFNKNVEPENLEQIARKLKVDLVYNILISTCPIFPYYHNKKSDNDNTNYGCIILNGNTDISVSTNDIKIISEIIVIKYYLSSFRLYL